MFMLDEDGLQRPQCFLCSEVDVWSHPNLKNTCRLFCLKLASVIWNKGYILQSWIYFPEEASTGTSFHMAYVEPHGS
jgi:hypothetical protein